MMFILLEAPGIILLHMQKENQFFCPSERKVFSYSHYAIILRLVGKCNLNPHYSMDSSYPYGKITK